VIFSETVLIQHRSELLNAWNFYHNICPKSKNFISSEFQVFFALPKEDSRCSLKFGVKVYYCEMLWQGVKNNSKTCK
jgi:hypothetical protein